MSALLVALGLAALVSLNPWAAKSVTPRLRVDPGLGVALGDAVAVSPGRRLAVAPARSAAGEQARSADVGASGGEGDAQPQLGIAPAHAVARSLPRPPGGASRPPAPEAAPVTPSPTPIPVAMPVAATAPPASGSVSAPPPGDVVRGGGSLPGPIGSGSGPIGGGSVDVVEVHAGDERAFSFSFYVQPSAFRAPGDENVIMRFRGVASESPTFGLRLWDDGGGQRGLWSSGEAMDGERFLAPVEEGVWHHAVVAFQASSEGDGFYLLLLDGRPIDVRAFVSLIDPGSDSARIETGLFRDGEPVAGSSDVFFGPTQLGETLESVIP